MRSLVWSTGTSRQLFDEKHSQKALPGEYCTSSFEANNRLPHDKMELTQNKAVGEIEGSCSNLLTSVNEKSKNLRQLSFVGVKSGERRSCEHGWFFQCNPKNQSPPMEKRLNRRQWLCSCCKGRNHYSTGTRLNFVKFLWGVLSFKIPVFRNVLHENMPIIPHNDYWLVCHTLYK